MPEEHELPTRHIIDRLLEQRTLLLSEAVMPDSAERLVAQLLYLNAQDQKAPITFYTNTPGGSISDGFAIFDTIRFIKPKVTTVCTGISASMGTVLMLAPSDKKRRVAMPNTRFMIHQPSSAYQGSAYQGSASDIEIGAKQILLLRDRLVQIYVEETGQTKENILRDLNRDYWRSAAEAVDYGLCDRVVEKLGDIV